MPHQKMQSLSPEKVGLSLGLLAAIMSVVYIVALQFGGTGLVSWLMALYFVDAQLTALPISFGGAIVSIISHFIIGAIIGALFAYIWNRVIGLE